MTTRAGIVAVVGRPNVGKSSFINAVVGRKVTIVTNKPQTTRHRIMAVHNAGDVQIVFVDTPGLHRQAGKAMNRLMNRTAVAALEDADVVLFFCEAARWMPEDDDVLKRLGKACRPVMLLMNKVDLVHPKERLLGLIDEASKRFDFEEIFPLSVKRGRNIDAVLDALPRFLPESPPLFPDGMHTDRSPEFRAAETVREKLTDSLQQELPYGLTVQIERYADEDDRTRIYAVVWVERASQKGIVVGRGGRVLKQVGSAARRDLADALGRPVHLELWVKVRENWADNEQDLARLGYESP